jgi:hypothetical protein
VRASSCSITSSTVASAGAAVASAGRAGRQARGVSFKNSRWSCDHGSLSSSRRIVHVWPSRTIRHVFVASSSCSAWDSVRGEMLNFSSPATSWSLFKILPVSPTKSSAPRSASSHSSRVTVGSACPPRERCSSFTFAFFARRSSASKHPRSALDTRAVSSGASRSRARIRSYSALEVANYKNVTIPTNLDVKDAVRQSVRRVLRGAVRSSTVEKNPGAVVTEYAWTAVPSQVRSVPGAQPRRQRLLPARRRRARRAGGQADAVRRLGLRPDAAARALRQVDHRGPGVQAGHADRRRSRDARARGGSRSGRSRRR